MISHILLVLEIGSAITLLLVVRICATPTLLATYLSNNPVVVFRTISLFVVVVSVASITFKMYACYDVLKGVNLASEANSADNRSLSGGDK